jgi:hypothetical protein
MILYLLLAACAGLIVFTEGGFHPGAFWNCLPLVPCLLVVRQLRRGALTPVAAGAAVGFLGGSLGLNIAGHVAWGLDLAGIASNSSTSALQLLMLPLYSVAAGLGGSLIGMAVGAGFTIRRSPERRRDTVPLSPRERSQADPGEF